MSQKGSSVLLFIITILFVSGLIVGSIFYIKTSGFLKTKETTKDTPALVPIPIKKPVNTTSTVSANMQTVQPDYSDNRTIKEHDNKITIDFSKCTPERRRIDVAFGSTTIVVRGKTNNFCIINYGGEVENPNWNGNLPFTCQVPDGTGLVEFPKGEDGVSLTAIQQYCSE